MFAHCPDCARRVELDDVNACSNKCPSCGKAMEMVRNRKAAPVIPDSIPVVYPGPDKRTGIVRDAWLSLLAAPWKWLAATVESFLAVGLFVLEGAIVPHDRMARNDR